MMSDSFPLKQTPPVIEVSDYATLNDLAYEALIKGFDVATELIDRLDKSIVVPDGQSTRDVVRLGSTVTYDVEGAPRRIMTLVHPDELDADKGRISALAPIGVALLGLRPGQRGQWFSRDGQSNELTVVYVVDE
ncbi:GreA/GreB family elongation factor [Pararhizobium sp. O133]|uniref:GreA/GreB family elongation factor n=1 Tax=Pararhizobium sp. O133 TaxID=3449278 RepID=UPI003F683A82